MTRIGWLDCASGASGDMLLGTVVDAGVPLADLQSAVDAVSPEPVTLRAEQVVRASIGATRVFVEGTESRHHRTWADVRALLDTPAGRHVPGIDRALATFRRLVEAEARVHRQPVETVHLHEVGALDAIADIVGVCAGFALLGLSELTATAVALGGGSVQAAHGRLAVPGPAVVLLLADAPTYGGPVEVELATPTGAALLAEWVTGWGPAPAMTGLRQAHGAGGRDLPGHPNVVRLLTGDPWRPGQASREGRRTGPEGDVDLIELTSTVDDLDPRVWPAALDELLAAGALDAWLVPALLRKGRPGHVVHALAPGPAVEAVLAALFTHTSTLGVRRHLVQRRALARTEVVVTVAGQQIRVKLGLLDSDVVNAQPEWDDVAAAAAALGLPARVVLDRARAAALDVP